MTYYPDDHPAFDMPEFNPEPLDSLDRKEEVMERIRATAVRFEGDEDGWHMLIDTDDELIDVGIHGCAWELFQNCDRTIGSEYRYAMSIKREVDTSREDDEDQGYGRDDPKHPAFHSTHADLWDQREGK